MMITENTNQTAHDYLDADVLYSTGDVRFLSEHDIYVPPCQGPEGVDCVLDNDYTGCGRCMGQGCYICTYVTCLTHE